jgi:hypothetical protein
MAKVFPRTARYEGKKLTYFERTLWIPLYEWKVKVVYAEDIHAVRRAAHYTKHMGLDAWALSGTASTAFCETDFKQRTTWIFLAFSTNGFKTASVGVMAHECYHAAYTILNKVRAQDSEEGIAYMLEWLIEFADTMACDIHDLAKKVLTPGPPSDSVDLAG